MLVLETKHYPKHSWRQQPLLTLRNRITGSASCIQVSVTGYTNIWGQQIHTYSLTPIVSLSFPLSSSHVSWTWLKILIPIRRQRVRTLHLFLCASSRVRDLELKSWTLKINLKVDFHQMAPHLLFFLLPLPNTLAYDKCHHFSPSPFPSPDMGGPWWQEPCSPLPSCLHSTRCNGPKESKGDFVILKVISCIFESLSFHTFP